MGGAKEPLYGDRSAAVTTTAGGDPSSALLLPAIIRGFAESPQLLRAHHLNVPTAPLAWGEADCELVLVWRDVEGCTIKALCEDVVRCYCDLIFPPDASHLAELHKSSCYHFSDIVQWFLVGYNGAVVTLRVHHLHEAAGNCLDGTLPAFTRQHLARAKVGVGSERPDCIPPYSSTRRLYDVALLDLLVVASLLIRGIKSGNVDSLAQGKAALEAAARYVMQVSTPAVTGTTLAPRISGWRPAESGVDGRLTEVQRVIEYVNKVVGLFAVHRPRAFCKRKHSLDFVLSALKMQQI
jgi:hypothetical protein